MPYGVVLSRQFFNCSVCALIFLAPEYRLSPEEEFRRYQNHQNSPDDQNYRAFLERLTNPLIKNLKPRANGLDYGCGPGPTLSVIMEERGFPTAVYDPCFFKDEKVLTQTYDFITCSEVAEHFWDPRKEFVLFSKLLKPGAWLAVMTEWVKPEQSFESWHYPKDPTHVSFYSPQTMEWIARQYGWKIQMPRENVALFQKGTV